MASGLTFFDQMLMLASVDKQTSVTDSRLKLNEIVNFFKSKEDYKSNVEAFARLRDLPPQVFYDCDGFFIPEDFYINDLPIELQHDSLGICRGGWIIYAGRFVYPCKDLVGNVMGWCGYDKFESPKYLDSTNYGYRAKTYMLWGMEKLPEYYRSSEPVFFVEGIVCTLVLRLAGFQALATLGSNFSPYVTRIVKRFGDRAIVINDADTAGSLCRESCAKYLPTVRCIQSLVAKDVDDSYHKNPEFIEELRKLSVNRFYESKLFI